MIKYTSNLCLILKLDAFWQNTGTANSFKGSKFGKWHSVLENLLENGVQNLIILVKWKKLES